ncbi:3-phosphoshikimate 1-carboxyvinyltransferase [Apilactobacillus ozensis]|uniref:3-phosphoshikimate 1-carboxyvinyltransferase n=1 Tax=Apilactobacillus ozensis TaxID=866801 RepID=UPI000AF65960
MAMGINGIITVPGDKSISHRSIIFGAMSNGVTTVNNFLNSADCQTTIKAFQAMGVKIEKHENQVVIHGNGHLSKPINTLNMGNSGTTTRLIMGLLSSQPFKANLVGDESLSRRPMSRVAEPLRLMNADIQTSETGTLPVDVNGKQLNGINYELPIPSAQVKSAIILAALNAKNKTTIIEPTLSRDHTERMLKLFSPKSIQKNRQFNHHNSTL